MTDHEYAIYDALTGVNEFGGKYAAQFPDTSNAKADFGLLPALVQQISPEDSRPGAPASPATEKKQSQIEEVWTDLKAIAKTARTIAKQEPGFDASFKLGDDSQRAVVEAAKAFLLELAKPGVAAKFVAFDLPADFVTDLQDDLAGIENSTKEQKEDKRESAGDTEKIRRLIKQGKEILGRLDTSVRNKFRNQPQILAEWQTASHVRRRSRKEKDPEPSPAGPPAN